MSRVIGSYSTGLRSSHHGHASENHHPDRATRRLEETRDESGQTALALTGWAETTASMSCSAFSGIGFAMIGYVAHWDLCAINHTYAQLSKRYAVNVAYRRRPLLQDLPGAGHGSTPDVGRPDRPVRGRLSHITVRRQRPRVSRLFAEGRKRQIPRN